MKKAYVKPSMESEAFVPNTYVAACDQPASTWSVNCNVPYGIGYYEKNGEPGYQPGDERIASGSGCGIWHSGVPEEPHANAMWQELGWGGEYYPVYHWVQSAGWDQSDHFTKVEDAHEWKPEKNHS